MILRTEYDLRRVLGHIDEVVALAAPVSAIADEGCWGHVPFAKAMAKAGKRAVLGRRVPWGNGWAVVLPRSPEGLRALYALPPGPLDPLRAAREAWFTLVPGLRSASGGPRVLPAYVPGLVRRPGPSPRDRGQADRPNGTASGAFPVAFSDNLYPRPEDREAWALMLGREASGRPGPQHILSPDEMLMEGATVEQLDRLTAILAQCDTPLPKAQNIHWAAKEPQTELERLARRELKRRKLTSVQYKVRLEHELKVIEEKDFADYFLVIADAIQFAKSRMLVGPARGSSCGSLVCWMLRITEVDPIRHNLLFERFIDLNRADLPDIDIDFADDRRHLVLEYLKKKYGEPNVAQLGTIMRYKPKSALTDVAKHGGVPLWELDKLKDVMIERSSGDSRYRNQLSDSFTELDIGKTLLEKYPVLSMAARLEDHARSAGTHAAGIVVCNRPITEYCAVVDGGAQIDKKMAEELNMLKIDALGLRTLSVIDECCELIGRDRETLYTLPLDDESVFSLLNAGKFGCIFQFAGIALQTVARQVKIDRFEDIAAITALARPGPLSGGETQRWIRTKVSGVPEPLHPALAPYTVEERGCIIYQEQVMRVCRELGNFSWADTAAIRKLMSKTLGNEAFAKFGVQFKAGAAANGVSDADAARIWKAIDQMGCLAGDTVLVNPFPNHATQKSITIAELAANRGRIRARKSADSITTIKNQQLYSLDTDSGKIKPQRCLDAFYSGEKLTALMKLDNGSSIRATLHHRFLRGDGEWIELQELRPGDQVAVMGATRPTARKAKKGTGSGAHNWWGKLKDGKAMYQRQLAALRKRFKRCQHCMAAPYQETHHRNGDHEDHSFSNLIPVCRSCHKALHGGASVPHTIGKNVEFSAVKSISKLKTVAVYDVSMPAPGHNFVANGIVAHNSWAFNKSHAVAYGLVSYWTAWLKVHHPVEFAVANLRHAINDDGARATLRELMREDNPIEFIPVDSKRSTDRWEYNGRALIGPLTGIKGIGAKTAREIIVRRANDTLKDRHKTLLQGVSKFEDYAPTRKKWGHLYAEPQKHFKTVTIIDEIDQLTGNANNERHCVIGRLLKKNLRSKNDEKWLAKRGGKRVPDATASYLLFNIEDDTGQILCCINDKKFPAMGKRIVEEAKIGTWFAVVGNVPESFQILMVENVRWL